MLDEREAFLYEPIGKVGYIVLFCVPYLANIIYLAVTRGCDFKYAKWLGILTLLPMIPYVLLIGLFAAWAYYPLLYGLMVLFVFAQCAMLWGASRASRA